MVEANGRRMGEAQVMTVKVIGRTTQNPIMNAQNQAAIFLLY